LRAFQGVTSQVWKAQLCGPVPGAGASEPHLTSKPLQPLLLPLLADDEEQGHSQRGQDHRAGDGEELLDVVALPLGRLDGGDGA